MLNLILILICLSISYFIIDALIKDVHNKALPKKVPIYTSQYKHIFSKALFISGLVFILSIILLILFDKSTNDPQFSLSLFFSDTLENTSLACLLINLTQIFNLYETSIDGLSVFFVILTTFLILLCFLEA
jgi:NADH:ubiquinone oxidoreductase subunit 4 (subunit M)